ncbi:dihydropteroate synthase [Celerinatantimonas sp. YJH-8]|uniref:dihydropteroate synthase n=1 Tax=Celerinatantimonas sp. YJH-8 TaxID=3228714 RepID=UPI0038C8301A
MKFTIAGQSFDHPVVMGILNCTPDSFSDGGRYYAEDKAIAHAKQMLDDGAEIIDIGGESTRPGAVEVSIEEELQRTLAPIRAIKAELGCLISIDTRHHQVMTEAVAAGADLINDINALNEPGALEAAVKSGADVCLMHMQGQPETMQQAPQYTNITDEVVRYLKERKQVAMAAGIAEHKIFLDPGFGFGKSLDHNYQLLNHMEDLHQLNSPLLIGLSRKSMLGNLLNRPTSERLAGSLAGACIATMKGAAIIRVHDVRETVDAVRVTYKTMVTD